MDPFGKYQLVRRIGSGGMAEVFLARISTTPTSFRCSISAQSAIPIFLAMEYVEGVDLLRLLHLATKQRTPIPFGVSAYVVQQAAKGLDY